jgi:hypothetical protein
MMIGMLKGLLSVDAVTIPEDRVPSYLNRYGFTGAKVGALGVLAIAAPLAAVGAFTAPWLNLPVAIIGGLAGGAVIGACSGVGCIQGKEQIARNQLEGRVIKAPSTLNEGVAQGLLNGALVSTAAYAVAAGIAVATGAASLLIPNLIAIAGVGVTAAAGYMQGKQYQEKMAVEYENAKGKAASMEQGMLGSLIEQVKDAGKSLVKAPKIDGPDIGPDKVTKEEWAEVRRRQEEGRHKGGNDWAEMIQELQADKAAAREKHASPA